MINRLKFSYLVQSVMSALKQLHAGHTALLARQAIIERQQAQVAERIVATEARLVALERGLVNVAAASFSAAPSGSRFGGNRRQIG